MALNLSDVDVALFLFFFSFYGRYVGEGNISWSRAEWIQFPV